MADDTPEQPKSLADAMREEQELLRRKVVHATRPRGPLTMQQAIALAKRMHGETE
jgi:phage FluMu protein gp41